jgi:hypothetical protein
VTKPKQPTPAVRVTTAAATCTMFATFAMVCPLCRLTIPANTTHSGQKAQP